MKGLILAFFALFFFEHLLLGWARQLSKQEHADLLGRINIERERIDSLREVAACVGSGVGRHTMSRSNYLLLTEHELLKAWGRDLYYKFDDMPYLVGSATERLDYRDVDVRVMLHPDVIASFPCPLETMNFVFSLWGQKVTGLPIDFQFQNVLEANAEFGGKSRHPLGVRRTIEHTTPTAHDALFTKEDDNG